MSETAKTIVRRCVAAGITAVALVAPVAATEAVPYGPDPVTHGNQAF